MEFAPKDFHVGQELWFVYSDTRRGSPRPVFVTAIGRKWIYLSLYNYRLNAETGSVEEPRFGGVGRVYLYKEDWENQQEANVLWSAFMDKTGYRFRPRNPDAVREAAKILGVSLPTTQEEEG